MRLRARPEQAAGWSHIVEGADSSLGFDRNGPIGLMDSCTNMIRTPTGLLVRGGSRVAVALVDAGAAAMSSVLVMGRYSQKGAAIIAHRAAASKHYGFLYSPDLATMHARVDLGWNVASPAKARLTELFEKVYANDATRSLASRQQLVSLDASGVLTAVTGRLNGTHDAALKPYAMEVYGNNLFIAGIDGTAGNANLTSVPAMVRHAFLGKDPSAALSWDKDAYNIIGNRGDFVTAMVRGDDSMLIAKEHELYRLTGSGRALEGWQYVVEPIDSTEHVGVEWPGALAFAEGRWYGVGKAGPFMVDGKQVVRMVNARTRSWARVVDLDQAVVRYYPEWRCVLFGLVYRGQTGIGQVWAWNIDDNVWVGDIPLPVTVVDLGVVADNLTGIGGSSGVGPNPTPPTLTVVHTSATQVSVAGTFVRGDASADTEIWIDKGAGYVLAQTVLAAAPATFSIGVLFHSAKYKAKARHVKDGVVGNWSAEVDAYTLLAPPANFTLAPSQTYVRVSVMQVAHLSELQVDRGATPIIRYPDQASGTVVYTDGELPCETTYTYHARSYRADWPAAINATAWVDATTATTGCGGNQL